MAGFGFDIGVEGEESLEGLQLALKNLPLHLTEEVHITALKKAAKPLRNRIDVTLPEDTGEFAKTLRVAKTKFKKDINQHQVVVGFKKGREDGKPLKGFIAHFHEYGTSKMRVVEVVLGFIYDIENVRVMGRNDFLVLVCKQKQQR